MNNKIKYWACAFFFASFSITADKNSFRYIGISETQTIDYFLRNHCNTQFDDSHPSSYEPNKTFLTFYGDSLGDFVDEPLYGYFGNGKLF